MNGDNLKTVRPGDPLRIPARAYNSFVDAVRAQQERRHLFGRTPVPGVREVCIAPGRNAAGEDAPTHGAATISGVSNGIV